MLRTNQIGYSLFRALHEKRVKREISWTLLIFSPKAKKSKASEKIL